MAELYALDFSGSDFPKELPYNLEAEQSVLGAVLIDSGCIPVVLQHLIPESFYRQQHQMLFSIVMRMFVGGEAIDFITVLDQAKQENIFPTEQDAKIYLTQLVQIVPTTVNVEAYAKIVKEKYYLRSLISTFAEIITAAREGAGDPNALMEMAEQKIYDIRKGKDSSGLVRLDEVILSTYDTLQRLGGKDREDYLGVPTGFTGLDEKLTGLNRSDLLFIAARPGMGKTSFVLNIALNVAKLGKKVAFFSLEMSKEQLAMRVLSSEACVASGRPKTGSLDSEDWVRLAVSSQMLSKLPLYLDDTPGITIGEMKAKLRRLKDVSLVCIDYLQLMQSGGKRSENRVQEVSEITRSLKIMAKEFDIPVIVLSQLSRGPESRSDKRPLLSDLRESGSIEQDADAVLFLYRDAYYQNEGEEGDQSLAECIIAKNRHGETATVPLGWDGQYTKFRNVELSRHEG